MDRGGLDSALTSVVERVRVGGSGITVEEVFLRNHRRMGHLSFPVLSLLYPSLYERAIKEKLVCDACELGKHTRSSYHSSKNRSSRVFDLIHSDVWGPCQTNTINGYRYFVTFIDCFSRVTWLYLMKNKSDVLTCFKDFHKAVQTQYGGVIKILRSDNGTEYTNMAFGEYLSTQGIQHQTTCPYTPAQNGVAERKNRHLLEVAHCMMISMNVPNCLWGQAVLTAAQLINRMPSRILEWKSPCEMLKGDNGGVLPLKVFGCVCFVKDNRPTVGKLDPRAIKCVFVGYSATQKGYVCWSPRERRLFVSMDVTFRESEPYYPSEVASPISDSIDRQEDERNEDERPIQLEVISDPVVREKMGEDELEEVEVTGEGGDVQAQGEMRVYQRRRKMNVPMPTVPLVPHPLSPPSPTPEIPAPFPTDSGDMIPHSSPFVTLRSTTRNNAGNPPTRYGFLCNIDQSVNYSNLSSTYGAFIALLDIVS